MNFDLFAEARAAVDRARAAQQAVNELVAPATDRDDQGSAGAVATASAGPYTPAELEALIEAVWSLEEDDPTRFDELLHAALVFLGRVALQYCPGAEVRAEQAALLLRSMELRALWGPDHQVVQP